MILPLSSKVFIVTLPKWRAIFVTARECDKKPIIRPNINSTRVASAVSLLQHPRPNCRNASNYGPDDRLRLQHNWASPCISTSDSLLPSIPLVGSVRWGQVELRRQQYISTAGSADKLKLEQLLKHDTAIDLQMLGFSKTTVNMHNNTLNCSSNCTENKVCYKHKASRSVLHMKTIAVWNH